MKALRQGLFFNGIEHIESISKRLQNVIIENQDGLKVWSRWDSGSTLVYFDPPYLPETRVTTSDYDDEMCAEQHLAFLNYITKKNKSMVIISGYKSEMYCDFLEPKFKRIELSTYSRGSLSNGKGYDSKRVECIWINYTPSALQNPLFYPNHQPYEIFEK